MAARVINVSSAHGSNISITGDGSLSAKGKLDRAPLSGQLTVQLLVIDWLILRLGADTGPQRSEGQDGSSFKWDY